jgi:hypothetical protein
MRPWFVLPLLFVVQGARSQLVDSIALFLQEPPRWVVKLDVRGSFISNQNVRVVGVKLGLEHARRFQYGVGYSFLLTPVEREQEVPGVGEVVARLRLGYVTPYVDYAFYQRGNWEVRLPVQIGLGAGSLGYRDADGRRHRIRRSGLVFYEPAMTVQYRFMKYLGVGGGIGYRLVLHTSEGLGEQLTAPTYTLGFRVFFDDIWRDLSR